jgi:hypothetical protein
MAALLIFAGGDQELATVLLPETMAMTVVAGLTFGGALSRANVGVPVIYGRMLSIRGSGDLDLDVLDLDSLPTRPARPVSGLGDRPRSPMVRRPAVIWGSGQADFSKNSEGSSPCLDHAYTFYRVHPALERLQAHFATCTSA